MMCAWQTSLVVVLSVMLPVRRKRSMQYTMPARLMPVPAPHISCALGSRCMRPGLGAAAACGIRCWPVASPASGSGCTPPSGATRASISCTAGSGAGAEGRQLRSPQLLYRLYVGTLARVSFFAWVTPVTRKMGGPASHTALIICHQSKSNSSTDGRKKAVTRGGQTDPLKFSVSSWVPQRIRPSKLSSDGGMAVLAALMASRRGRTRWGRAAGLRAPRFGARAGR